MRILLLRPGWHFCHPVTEPLPEARISPEAGEQLTSKLRNEHDPAKMRRLAWPLFWGSFLGNAGIAAAESCGALQHDLVQMTW